MATASIPHLVTIEEYLASSYEPDLEFVDGVLEEKNMGEWDHSYLQAAISAWFYNHRAEWKINVLTEYRTRTRASRVRLPDICIVRQGEPVERVRVSAPLLCIEILSPEDRPGRVMKRLDELVAIGTEHVWILDPADRSAATYSRFGMKPLAGTRFEISGTAIFLDVPETFATLDQESAA
jgi:Uma2 family endonuclease